MIDNNNYISDIKEVNKEVEKEYKKLIENSEEMELKKDWEALIESRSSEPDSDFFESEMGSHDEIVIIPRKQEM